MRFSGLAAFFSLTWQSRSRATAGLLVLAFVVSWAIAPVSARELPYGQGLLWKIEPPVGGADPSYLFGTIHVTDQRVLNLPSEVRDAFETSQSATFEIRQTGSGTAKMREMMMLEHGETLHEHLSRPQRKLLAKAAELYGIPEHVLYRFKPWALYMMFAVPPSEAKRASRGKKMLDFSLQTRARDFGKPVYALETLDEQLRLFDEMDYPKQVEYLDSLLRNLDEAEADFERFLQLYLERNLSGLQAMMVAELEADSPEVLRSFQEDLLDRRNLKMADRMEERLQEGGAFVAVGALHLPGEKGVLSLLHSKGYKLTRLY